MGLGAALGLPMRGISRTLLAGSKQRQWGVRSVGREAHRYLAGGRCALASVTPASVVFPAASPPAAHAAARGRDAG
jgi:hypothetical protein